MQVNSNEEQPVVPPQGESFQTLQLHPEVLRSLKEIGYNSMFPIQAGAIPPLLEGKDVIGQAHTGSGKTAAFALPILQRIDESKPYVQALVVVPTRELALQVTDEFNKLATHLKIKAYPIYGGVAISPQIERLQKRAPQVVVATPGRLIDHLERGTIDLGDVAFVVLDEADRMLDMGFIDDVDYILKKIPSGSQTALFSATMPREIVRLADRYMNDPVEVLIDSDELSIDEIDQSYALVDDRTKFNALVEYIRKSGISSGIIFCDTKIKTQRLAERLQAQGFRAAPIHGDLSQNRREHAMQNFRSGHVELLIATDVASRGIDVPKVGHVINYTVPQDPLTYFHRIGRTARAGRAGKAITFVTNSEYPDFSRIQGMTQAQIKRVTDLLPPGYRPATTPNASDNFSSRRNQYSSERRHFRDNRNPRSPEASQGPESHERRGPANEQRHGRGFSFTERTASQGGHWSGPNERFQRNDHARRFNSRPRRPANRR
jgi:ATP-dependent RNA helicase DeaD